MAKRKRLTPAEIGALEPAATRAPQTKSIPGDPFGVTPAAPRRAPIAQVAGDAATQAALEEVAGELNAARASGRMVLELPISAVDENYLVRDRMMADEAGMDALEASLGARGQQTPIDVVETGQGRYGLISGWRRLMALRRLNEHGTVQALLRSPADAADAYLAMVEENEIRVGLSYYERARIVARAAQLGAYHTEALALKGLFGAVSRTKRSKIGSFLKLYRALDDRLRYPSAISERLGLELVRALEADPDLGARLRERLRKSNAKTGQQEVELLHRALAEKAREPAVFTEIETEVRKFARMPEALREVAPGVYFSAVPGGLKLSGRGVDATFQQELLAWLALR